jgi:hypothetical protein
MGKPESLAASILIAKVSILYFSRVSEIEIKLGVTYGVEIRVSTNEIPLIMKDQISKRVLP